MNISLKNVSFSYTESLDDAVIKNLNFEIKSGECVVLVGESGCGKTTISKLINGLIPLYQSGTMAGDVLLGDKNTADMTLAEISRHVGSVFQNPRSQFFNIDTDSEIAFGCENLGMDPEEIRERVNRVVKEFHIEHLAGRNIFHLSGGEKQKIACASVSATDPEIFVLDEPSANLDLKTVADLAEIIKFWKSRGKTVVIVEHRIHYLRDIADRICYVKDGCIAHEWTPAELEAKCPEYAASLGLRCMNLEQLSEGVNVSSGVILSDAQAESKDLSKQSTTELLVFKDLHFAYNRKLGGTYMGNGKFFGFFGTFADPTNFNNYEWEFVVVDVYKKTVEKVKGLTPTIPWFAPSIHRDADGKSVLVGHADSKGGAIYRYDIASGKVTKEMDVTTGTAYYIVPVVDYFYDVRRCCDNVE